MTKLQEQRLSEALGTIRELLTEGVTLKQINTAFVKFFNQWMPIPAPAPVKAYVGGFVFDKPEGISLRAVRLK
jgi:hypothetical protein